MASPVELVSRTPSENRNSAAVADDAAIVSAIASAKVVHKCFIRHLPLKIVGQEGKEK
jgi:hypothetical protein